MSHQYKQFYHPRYWLTWLALGLLYVITKLPYQIQLLIGRGVGTIGYLLLKRRRHIAKVNLSLCFPELSATQAKQLLKAHFKSLGLGVIEAGMAWWLPSSRIAKLGHIEGAEHLSQALAGGKGVLLLSGHFTTLEIAARIVGARFPIRCIYRPQKNKLFNHFMEQARQRNTTGIIRRDDTRAIIRNLKANAPIYYAADQDHGLGHGIFVPFFGIPAATITVTSRLAAISQAAVVPVFHYRLANGDGYRIVFQHALTDFPSADIEKDTLRINQIIENDIREKPEQYLWIHRRFKNRPAGDPGVY